MECGGLMLILGIESSCDETAAAVVENGRKIVSSVVATQIEKHKIFGGVVPEIASRMHTEAICAVTKQALSDANCKMSDIDAIAVTYAPGLIGALLVGVNYAKGLSLSSGVPLVPVHHLRSHIAANYLSYENLKPPFLCLVVSGGNTLITEVKDYTDFKILGRTRDDAAGEALDKAARTLGLDYPGGVNLDKIAKNGNSDSYKFPRPHVDGSPLDFSFSGLKTAVMNLVNNTSQKGGEIDVPVLCATVRQRVCDMLISATLAAAEKTGFKTIAVAGGVSANSELRARLKAECEKKGLTLYYPELKYCGDNAAMVGVQAYYEFKDGNTAGAEQNAAATMPINYR